MKENPAITFESVTVRFGTNIILDEINAIVPRGQCTAVIGPNGAGKTTLLLSLLGEIPYKGRIVFNCGNKEKIPVIGYVPQRLQFDRSLPLTVLEFMVVGLQRYPVCFGLSWRCREKAMFYLASVKADNLYSRRLGALSGGELQRVLLALALMQEPEILILDEPASGVDFHGEILFCELLEKLRKEHSFTQLMVSHDLSTVTHHAGYIICLNRKVAAQGSPAEVLNQENLTAIFGLHMGLIAKNSLRTTKLECECCKEKNNDRIKSIL